MQFGGDGYGFGATYVYDSQFGWQRAGTPRRSTLEQASRRREVPTSLWAQSITLISFFISMIIGYLAIRQAWRRNQQEAAARGGGGGRQRQQGPQHSHSERVALTARLIQNLPIQVHHTKEELASKSISELKALLKEEVQEIDGDKVNANANPTKLYLEKEDLIDTLLDYGTASRRPHDSSAESCSICCEEYNFGDLKRVLPTCGHQFHVECVDRWFLSSTDYSRPASCPMCNTELKEDG